jgi:hypothetical protein
MSKLRVPELLELLYKVRDKANLEVDNTILEVVAGTSEGSPRATVVALEKVLGITDIDEAIELLYRGTEQDVEVIELCKLLSQDPQVREEKWNTIAAIADSMDQEPEGTRKCILGYLRHMLVTGDPNNKEAAKNIVHAMSILTSRYYVDKATLVGLCVHVCFSRKTEFV